MIPIDNVKNNLIRLFNFLPYNVGSVLKYSLIMIFNFIIFISVKLSFIIHYLLSGVGISGKLVEIYIQPEDSHKKVFNKIFHEIIKIIHENDIEVFYLNNSICLNILNKNEAVRLISKLKKDKSLWIRISSEYGTYDYRICLIPNTLIYFLLMSSNSFILYKSIKSPDRRIVFGSESGCNIEIWINSDIHYKDKENYKRTVYKIASGDWLKEKNLLIEKGVVSNLALSPYKTDFPIDIVFTWVDGSDPEWQNSFNTTIKKYKSNELLGASTNESRFRNFNELKYSLRSICMYADFFNKIYIVTAGQVPEWLDTKNKRIEIVDHESIFPKGDYLPTFNSHAIESRLHHIKELSENYLYFNDDFLIGRPLTPSNFFLKKDISYFFATESTYIGLNNSNSKDLPVDSAAKNNRDIILSMYGSIVTNKFGHVPYPQLKSVLNEIEKNIPEILDKTARSKFRNINDISLPSSFYHHYAKLNGRAVPGNIKQTYIDISNKNSLGHLKNLLNLDICNQPQVFCINDVDYYDKDIAGFTEILQNTLESYFPIKSEFEK